MTITRHWLRLWRNGPGLAWKPASAEVLFSQRMGIDKTYVLFGWRFWVLKSWPRP